MATFNSRSMVSQFVLTITFVYCFYQKSEEGSVNRFLHYCFKLSARLGQCYYFQFSTYFFSKRRGISKVYEKCLKNWTWTYQMRRLVNLSVPALMSVSSWMNVRHELKLESFLLCCGDRGTLALAGSWDRRQRYRCLSTSAPNKDTRLRHSETLAR